MVENNEKVLQINDILEFADSIDEYSTYVVNPEKNEVIKYNAVFSETKIEELITELFNHIQYDIDNGVGYFTNDQRFAVYINFLIIKYFTNLKDVLSDSLEENITVITKLRKVRYFKLMFDEVFDNNEVIRVFELVNEVAIKADKLLTMKKEDIEKLNKKVKTDYYKQKSKNFLASMK